MISFSAIWASILHGEFPLYSNLNVFVIHKRHRVALYYFLFLLPEYVSPLALPVTAK